MFSVSKVIELTAKHFAENFAFLGMFDDKFKKCIKLAADVAPYLL